ncbi:MAG: phage portal protein [Tissierellia bacterium]|nr:phage portal protein [Tissierellia bacterium]
MCRFLILKILDNKAKCQLAKNMINSIRDMRVINLFTTSSELGNAPDVDFLSKPNADTTQENLLDRLEEKIYQLSMVPNMSDENFGTSSGIALSYKLQGLDNLCKTKERKFTAGLNRRYRLLCNLPNAVDHDAWQSIVYQFNRNMPKNVLEEAQVVNTLNGLVSKETALSYLSIVDNAKSEIKKMNEEDGFENDLGDHAHPDNWSMEDVINSEDEE